MKILQVIPSFIPAYSYGGPLKVCFDLSKELILRGHEVTVATSDALDRANRIMVSEEEIEGVKIIRFRNLSNRLAKNFNAYLPFGYFIWVRKNLTRFDVVHCHDFFTLQNIITSYFCLKYNIPYIIQPHGTLAPISQNSRFKRTKKGFLKLFSHVLQNAKNIIVLTEVEKNYVQTIDHSLADKIEVIPNGIIPAEFEGIAKIDLYDRFKIARQNKIIGFIGRIQYIKGIDITLDILAGLKGKLDFTYLVIGPDEGEKEKLEKKITELGLENHVRFAGILQGREKMEIMKSCDLFLFTSRSEGQPMTILEVAALGVPQIISNTCNVPEVGRHEAGFVIDLMDKESFVDTLIRVLKDSELQKRLSMNAIKLVKEHFDVKVVCDRIELILKSLLLKGIK